MNRRSFLSSLLGAAVAASTRWLPMPAAPVVEMLPAPVLSFNGVPVRMVDRILDEEEIAEITTQMNAAMDAFSMRVHGCLPSDWVGLEPRYSSPLHLNA
jgi:hypothetical protein